MAGGDMSEPDRKPQASRARPHRAPQRVWDMLNTGHPLMSPLNKFSYLDRVGPEMFVGRYDHGTCGTIREDDAKHADRVKIPSLNVYSVKARNHAYIVTVTPDGAEGICLYCGTTMDGCPEAALEDTPWDEPWEKPRRATKREMDAMSIRPVPEHVMLYLDEVDGKTAAGRFRVGDCPEGGTHEAVLHFWNYNRDARRSFCVFCGAQWAGSPPGFWEAVQPHIKVEEELARHAEAVRQGRY